MSYLNFLEDFKESDFDSIISDIDDVYSVLSVIHMSGKDTVSQDYVDILKMSKKMLQAVKISLNALNAHSALDAKRDMTKNIIRELTKIGISYEHLKESLLDL